ncbi:MAG: hypothetical protein NTY15_07190 [Planctomycetota bacterium]|nr:hypothetical protein [Planctomycetota bacterium]
MREEIARMVRYHGRPVFLSERESPTYEIVRHSWLVSNRLLHLFAIDTRGRDTESMSRPEENLHYWKLLAEEVGCFSAPYPFQSEHARFVYFRQRTPDLHYVPHGDHRFRVTLMAGLPGSGKDSWLAKHRPQLPIVSLDQLRDELDVEPTDNQGTVAQVARERYHLPLVLDKGAVSLLNPTKGSEEVGRARLLPSLCTVGSAGASPSLRFSMESTLQRCLERSPRPPVEIASDSKKRVRRPPRPSGRLRSKRLLSIPFLSCSFM